MNVNEFIEKLRRYKGNSEPQISLSDAEKFITSLIFPDPIITVDVMNKLYPKWTSNMSGVKFNFKYQVNFSGIYVYMFAKIYDDTEEDYVNIEIELVDDHEDLYYQITDRLESMLDTDTNYEHQMCVDMFSKELLDLFDDQGITISSTMERGYDT